MIRLLLSFIVLSSALSADPQCKPDLTLLYDISTAAKPIQETAKTVVRIAVGDGQGTGFFVSHELAKNPLLVTNNHVIGSKNCTKEGCYATLDFDFQRGGAWKAGQEVYLKPRVNIGELDVNAFEVFEIDGKGKVGKAFVAPHSSKLVTTTAKEDKAAQLTVIGHPEGGLKKWAGGKCTQIQGDWRKSNHCCLGGNSGSPVVNEKGEVTGVLHRGNDIGTEMTSLDAVRHVTYISTSTIVKRFMDAQLGGKEDKTLKNWTSLGKNGETEDEDAGIEEMLTFLHSRRIPQLVIEKDEKLPVTTLLLIACQEEVKDLAQSEDPDMEYPVCRAVFQWLNCNEPKKDAYYKSCPAKKEREAFLAVFKEIAEDMSLRNQEPEFWVTDAPAAFEPSKEKAAKVKLAGYRELYKDEKAPLSLHIAGNIAAVALKKEELVFKEEDTAKSILDYAKREHFDTFFEEIIKGTFGLLAHSLVEKDAFHKQIESLLKDKKLPVPMKLQVETDAFELGELK